ncbi:putative immunity protein [Paeniglutamicibacter cryotolerans]
MISGILQSARAWVRGEAKMMKTRAVGRHAMGARPETYVGAARYPAYTAGQAGVVAHVAAGQLECQWQREQRPMVIQELVPKTSGCATTSAGRFSTQVSLLASPSNIPFEDL